MGQSARMKTRAMALVEGSSAGRSSLPFTTIKTGLKRDSPGGFSWAVAGAGGEEEAAGEQPANRASKPIRSDSRMRWRAIRAPRRSQTERVNRPENKGLIDEPMILYPYAWGGSYPACRKVLVQACYRGLRCNSQQEPECYQIGPWNNSFQFGFHEQRTSQTPSHSRPHSLPLGRW